VTDVQRPSTSEPEGPAPAAPPEPRQAPEITFAGGDEPRAPWVDDAEEDVAPLLDPYLHAPKPPAPQANASALAASALIAALLLGPLGAILAIVFGWYARQRIELRDPGPGGQREGRVIANLAIVLGVVLTMAWGGALSYVAWTRLYRPEPMAAAAAPAVPPEPFAAPRTPAPTPKRAAPAPSAPQHTKVQHEGQITVVDVGVETPSLAEELARQRAEASTSGETVLMMTTSGDCAPCRGVEASLRDPLMQSALGHVRLVRVDLYAFHEDLDALKMPHDRYPGFFLLALDLSPRDGIDGGEWGDDVAANIAPVLGAFMRGKYAQRKEAWKPVAGSGMSL
jgi:hypothetical protein